MAKFINIPALPVVGKRSNSKTEYRASGPLRFQADDGVVYEVPLGWRSDGVSWPTWLPFYPLIFVAVGIAVAVLHGPLWAAILGPAYAVALAVIWFVKPAKKLLIAAFVHDWACEEKNLFPHKAVADSMLLQAMTALGVSVIYRLPIYWFVRLRPDRVEWAQPDLKPVDDDAGNIIGWD